MAMNEEKAMDETTEQMTDTENGSAAQDADSMENREIPAGEEAAGKEEMAGDEEAETSGEPVEETSEKGQTEDEAEGSVKKGFFGKKKEKKDKKDVQIEELNDRVRRQMAEFDNFRKRTEKEKAAMYEIGARSVIEKILPVVDNFERGLAAVEEGCEDPFMEGMQKIYKQMMSTLEAMDVKPIEAVGTEFNPDYHNAVMHVDDENLGENVVAEELLKGYMYRDTVVRHSMVKVAN